MSGTPGAEKLRRRIRVASGIPESACRPFAGRNTSPIFMLSNPANGTLFSAIFPAAAIGSNIHFPNPDHWQTPFRQTRAELHLPITETATRCVLSLPCFPEMNGEEVQRVIDGCNSWQT